MIKVTVNGETRRGHANCARTASEAFGIDEEGKVVLLFASAPPQEKGAIQRAAYDGPTESIEYSES